MSLADINPLLLKPTGNGYETLRDVIKSNKLKTITKRDALFLVNKQMEGISETKGNIYIYMFYFSCVPSGKKQKYSKTWYNGVRPNDTTKESTAWCGCYTSFAMNWSGISPNGSAGSNGQARVHNLKQNGDYNTAKSMDLIQYGVSGKGHTGFLLKESTTNPNGYNKPYFVFGGNQSDSVNVTTPSSKGLNGFYSNTNYDTQIDTGEFLSVLAYFVNANTKSIDERKKEISARTTPNVKIGTSLEKEVYDVRSLVNDKSKIGSGYYLNEGSSKDFVDRFKELVFFEESLESGSVPVTQNITGAKSTNVDR